MSRRQQRDFADAAGPGWHGTGKPPAWAREILARDGDVTITDDMVVTLHRPGETPEEYSARVSAASPPLSPRQKEVIRAAVRGYRDPSSVRGPAPD
jgi:hypothetical protein